VPAITKIIHQPKRMNFSCLQAVAFGKHNLNGNKQNNTDSCIICSVFLQTLLFLLLFIPALIFFIGCKKTKDTTPALSPDKTITAFVFKASNNPGLVLDVGKILYTFL
jgi:hypothetical protein